MPYVNGKFYVEIKPDTEIIRVEDESQLSMLNELNEVKELSGGTNTPALTGDILEDGQLPQLRGDEVCAHWERELVFLSEINFELSRKTGNDIIVGGYCPDCKKDLGQPKESWYPKVGYKK